VGGGTWEGTGEGPPGERSSAMASPMQSPRDVEKSPRVAMKSPRVAMQSPRQSPRDAMKSPREAEGKKTWQARSGRARAACMRRARGRWAPAAAGPGSRSLAVRLAGNADDVGRRRSH